MISRLSKKQEAVYDFVAFMANKKNALFNCTTGWTGVQPGMKFEYIPPMGTGNVSDWTGANPPWNEDDVVEYLKAYYAVLAAPVQQEYLRIPGAAEYWHELDVNVSAVLAGQIAAEGGARRHRRGLGEDHGSIRARQTEGALQGVFHLSARRGPRPCAADL